MLAMYSDTACRTWASALPFVQVAHNSAYSTMLRETPHVVMIGRPAGLPVDAILGVPPASAPQSLLEYTR